ncbi:sulfite exporter TauE/SafE family protein [Bradyrhizobium genosp. P]|uniref:sulfite exporter TauE/SafE family protein n=1 Tax=Bradyrhizobium genosp. P TaxID=83641 RepID=UPI003CF6A823
MIDHLLIFIAFAFLLAGFVKGTLGLGLPTVAMGLLAVTMPPGQAIAIVIVPAIVTNIWQTFVGPYLRDILKRLWPLMLGTVIGIWLNAGLLTGPYAVYGTIVLGLLLVIYAIVGLSKFSFKVARRNEKWIGGIVGVVTGLISAATGVQVIPSMPFMQAIGLERDELVQALGVFFTTATVALAFNLTAAGLLTSATAVPGAVAMVASFTGMFIGQAVRTRMQPEVFRRWFLISMILLGLYLAGSALMKLHGSLLF